MPSFIFWHFVVSEHPISQASTHTTQVTHPETSAATKTPQSTNYKHLQKDFICTTTYSTGAQQNLKPNLTATKLLTDTKQANEIKA